MAGRKRGVNRRKCALEFNLNEKLKQDMTVLPEKRVKAANDGNMGSMEQEIQRENVDERVTVVEKHNSNSEGIGEMLEFYQNERKQRGKVLFIGKEMECINRKRDLLSQLQDSAVLATTTTCIVNQSVTPDDDEYILAVVQFIKL
ncbi:unnamed protein product [Allacma fusca]|uniref:Uncharacterized protein n=1 Tax=Allacma fusca TaxID=39272 RepID=A0A8J2K1B5_9HEXA|nr:unnamed protein product [Allacma fusca]